jgi:hypothetical protein
VSDPGIVMLSLGFFATVVLTVKTIATAVSNLAARRAEQERGTLGRETEERLARIEYAMEAIAVEVERISEGQRFTTKLLSDRAAAGAAAPRPPQG